ncbi:LysM peptidoglycan-binding domain-containing protein [Chryseobacterium polytrichastri]|uniref:LysM domain-containing protein n=1 Tax=Chryseobacterium polytrichastri TaxID=1302687 RepID=A0A1M7L3F5_9FLAO|nr:LysM peptidoglycan-binding domain-containing protein [Chryseobacterium polytrichastri]SHM72601.1 hypothetical protein SAMN05444267_10823 [Chryseobacterium polytrichastri]
MEIDYMQYKIRNGDSLHSISSRLGMTVKELKRFHNAHCEKADTLWFENMNHVDFLWVPKNYKTEEQKVQEKTNSLPSLQLSNAFYAKEYKVRETIQIPSEDLLLLDYTIILDTREGKDKSYTVTIDRKGLTTNGKIPNDKMSELSLDCMKTLYPIAFTINPSGKITGFHGYKALIKKFKDQRPKLEEYHIGEGCTMLLNAFEKQMSDETGFLRQFDSSLLFQTLFPIREWFHKKTTWTEKLYCFQNSFPAIFDLCIETNHDDPDYTETIIQGNLQNICSLQSLKQNKKNSDTDSYEAITADLQLQYTIHKTHKILSQAESSIVITNEGDLYRKHHLTLTQMI